MSTPTESVRAQFTPVMQDKFVATHGQGNCLQACVASILGLKLDEVPAFQEADDMVHTMDRFLASRGLRRIGISFATGFEWGDVAIEDVHPIPGQTHNRVGGEPLLMFGKSPRTGNHAIVGRFVGRYNYELMHDPHPDGDGIVGDPTSIHFFVPMRSTLIGLSQN